LTAEMADNIPIVFVNNAVIEEFLPKLSLLFKELTLKDSIEKDNIMKYIIETYKKTNFIKENYYISDIVIKNYIDDLINSLERISALIHMDVITHTEITHFCNFIVMIYGRIILMCGICEKTFTMDDDVELENNDIELENDADSKDDAVESEENVVESEENVVKPENDIKSENDDAESEDRAVESEKEVVESEENVVKPENDIKSENDDAESEDRAVESEENIVESEENVVKSENDIKSENDDAEFESWADIKDDEQEKHTFLEIAKKPKQKQEHSTYSTPSIAIHYKESKKNKVWHVNIFSNLYL
jgi:hypothetical protein